MFPAQNMCDQVQKEIRLKIIILCLFGEWMRLFLILRHIKVVLWCPDIAVVDLFHQVRKKRKVLKE